MIDALIQMVLSNAILALVLAIIALAIGSIFKRPQLAHLLWLLVLIKLLTPPVITIPVITIPELQVGTVVVVEGYVQPTLSLASNSTETWLGLLDAGKNQLYLIWLLGSILVFGWSLVRIYRFNRLLVLESEAAPQELQTAAAGIADRLGIKTVPIIYTTAAQLSPMVWWVGGSVRVVVPAALHDRMGSRHFQWVLAHELAHVRRRDYLVRCIEWLACVCFWWNPVMWWARYNLRINEELCCDALVVSSLKPKPHIYGNSLAKAVEYLSAPAYLPPAIASEVNSGGFLKRRIRMIVSDKLYRPNSRWLQVGILSCALAVLVLGLACETGQAVTNPEAQSEEGTLSISEEQIPDSVRATLSMIYLDQMGRPVQRAVWAEELTEEEAKLTLAEAERRYLLAAENRTVIDRGDAYRQQLEAAMEADTMTNEEAEARIAKAFMTGAGQTSEEADNLLRRYEERMRDELNDMETDVLRLSELYQAQNAQNRITEDFDTLRQRIEDAVKAGIMSREEADDRIAEAFMWGVGQTSEEADSLLRRYEERMRDELIRKEADLLRLREYREWMSREESRLKEVLEDKEQE